MYGTPAMKCLGLRSCIACAMLVAALGARAAAPASASIASRCPWVESKAPIRQRVGELLDRMSLEQKLHELHGVRGGAYVGVVPAIPSLCIPALTMQDGPGGMGDGMRGATQLPAPIALAATWDTGLARQYGSVIGAEARGKGVNVNLGPTLNIVRDPRWGRAFETYGEDPWLTGQLGSAYVEGVQGEGVMAQIKHVAMYNQETNRNTPADNVIVDERTMQELYLPQFASVVHQAQPASAMCSYSTINGVIACQDGYTLTRVLREEFGFRGFVVSDWGGAHSTVASAKAGMNMEMPYGNHYGAALERAVKSGAVSHSTVDDLLRPILAEMFRFHLFTRPRTGTPEAIVTTPAHVQVAATVAEQGAVLLKNADHVLPLSAAKLHSIAVIGSDAAAGAVTVGGGSAHVEASSTVTPMQGIVARAGHHILVRYAQGNTPVGEPPAVPAEVLTPTSGGGHGLTGSYYGNETLSGKAAAVHNATGLDFDWHGAAPVAGVPAEQWSAKWTGTLTPPTTGRYTFSLTSDDGSRLTIDGKRLIDNWGDHASNTKTATVPLVAGHRVEIEVDYYQAAGGSSLRLGWRVPDRPIREQESRLQQAVRLAAASDVAIVFAGDFETEGSDLVNIDLPGNQNRLIAAVAAANPNTIVVLNTGSAVTMPWLDAVKAVIEAWYPGQEDGHAIAALLFGDVDPSGKLPVTFPKRLADVPASSEAQWPGIHGRIEYSEALDVGYRWYDAEGIEPLFAFGHGLSYTTFGFDHLKLTPRTLTPTGNVSVEVSITNTGRRRGADVVQLYIGHPPGSGEPPKQLKGFRKVTLDPGQTRRVRFDIPAHAFATWNPHTHAWQVAEGVYRIMLGDSSDHLPARATVRVLQRDGSQQ